LVDTFNPEQDDHCQRRSWRIISDHLVGYPVDGDEDTNTTDTKEPQHCRCGK
jgi:hypothetical protein